MKEYKEFEVPVEMQDKLRSMAGSETEQATLGGAGVIGWVNKLSSEGWTPVWQAFQFPFLIFEREVQEEVEN